MIRRTFIDGDDHLFVDDNGDLQISVRNSARTLIVKDNLRDFAEFLLTEVSEQSSKEELNVK